jgi:hypothetical protein
VGVISHSRGGGLAASLSSSDLRGLLPEHFVALAAPVLHFLTAKASAGWAGQQQKPSSGSVLQQQPQQSPRHDVQLEQVSDPPAQQVAAITAQGWGLKVNGSGGSRTTWQDKGVDVCCCVITSGPKPWCRQLQGRSRHLAAYIAETWLVACCRH